MILQCKRLQLAKEKHQCKIYLQVLLELYYFSRMSQGFHPNKETSTCRIICQSIRNNTQRVVSSSQMLNGVSPFYLKFKRNCPNSEIWVKFQIFNARKTFNRNIITFWKVFGTWVNFDEPQTTQHLFWKKCNFHPSSIAKVWYSSHTFHLVQMNPLTN